MTDKEYIKILEDKIKKLEQLNDTAFTRLLECEKELHAYQVQDRRKKLWTISQ